MSPFVSLGLNTSQATGLGTGLGGGLGTGMGGGLGTGLGGGLGTGLGGGGLGTGLGGGGMGTSLATSLGAGMNRPYSLGTTAGLGTGIGGGGCVTLSINNNNVMSVFQFCLLKGLELKLANLVQWELVWEWVSEETLALEWAQWGTRELEEQVWEEDLELDWEPD